MGSSPFHSSGETFMYDPFRIDFSSPAVVAALLAQGLRLPTSGQARAGADVGSARGRTSIPERAAPVLRSQGLPAFPPPLARNRPDRSEAGASSRPAASKPDRPNPRWLPDMAEPDGWEAGGNISSPEQIREHAVNAYRQFKINVGRGMSPQEAGGWAANSEIESGNKHTRRQDPGPGRGLYQWGANDPRLDRRIPFQERYGHPIEQSTEEEQLDFRDWELRNSYANVRRRLDAEQARTDRPPSAGRMSDIIMRYYESPREQERNGIDRRNIANELIRMSIPRR